MTRSSEYDQDDFTGSQASQCDEEIPSKQTQRELFGPFFHEDPQPIGLFETLKILLLGPTLFPLRLLLITSILTLVFLICIPCCLGQRPFEKDFHLRGIRRIIAQRTIKFGARCILFVAGFYHIKRVGTRPPQQDTRLPAIPFISNHTSWADALILVADGRTGIICKASLRQAPLVNYLLVCLDAVFVDRKNKDSRGEAAREIQQRCGKEGDFHVPLTLFPEGTTSNGHQLLRFRTGAFVPGVPVQPVFINYPAKRCSVSWVVQPFLWNVFRVLTQLTNNAVVHYLPLYVPNDLERSDASIYAGNVNAAIGKYAGIPTSELSVHEKLVFQDFVDKRCTW